MVEIQKDTFIRVYSDLNTWMDCIVRVSDEELDHAKEVLEKAWDEFWEDENEKPYGDLLSSALEEAEIEYEIYYCPY